MKITNEHGRSMVEMLGVLAIIGVLSVGGLSIIGKARQQSMITNMISEISNLAMNARKLSCDYDDGYGSYTNMLYQSSEYPEGLRVTLSSGKATAFVLSSDATVSIEAAGDNFTMTIGNIPEESCVAVVSSDWGKRNINGYISASIGSATATNEKIDLDDAVSGCTANANLILTYLACPRGGE